MAVFNFSDLNPEIRELKTYYDPESGCRVYDDRQAFESCKQSYYLKKQTEQQSPANNEVLDKNGSSSEMLLNNSNPQAINTELADIREEINNIKNESGKMDVSYLNILYFCSGVSLVLILLIITNVFSKIWKKKKTK